MAQCSLRRFGFSVFVKGMICKQNKCQVKHLATSARVLCDEKSNEILSVPQFGQTIRYMSSSDNSITNQSIKRRPNNTTKVLYDGDCKICEVEISAFKKITRNKDNIEFINISSPDYDEAFGGGVSYEDAMKEMHVVGPDGKIYTQGDAVRYMYRVSGLGFLAALTELPLIRPACDQLYVHFAKYRLRNALNRCDSGSCDIKLKNLRDNLKKKRLDVIF